MSDGHGVVRAFSHIRPPTGSLLQAFGVLYQSLSKRRCVQLFLSLGLMLLGACAEFLTIGAVLPFLAIITDAEAAQRIPAIRLLFDLLGWNPGDNLIFSATLLLVGAAVVAAILRLTLVWVTQKLVFRIAHDISTLVYSRLLHQPYYFHAMNNSSIALSGMEKIQISTMRVLLPLMQACTAAIIATFVILALLAVDPVVTGLAAGVMVTVYICVSLASRKILRRNSVIEADMQTRRIKQIQEGLGGIRDILIDHSQGVFENAFRRFDNRLRKAQAANAFVGAAPRFVVEAAGIALIALLAYYLSMRPGGVIAAIPVLGAMALGAQRLLPLLQLVYNGWSQVAASRQAFLDIVDLIQLPTISSTAGSRHAAGDGFERNVVFDSVEFRYFAGPPVLKNVNLVVARGQRVGIIGETGSGKSTFFDLLMGLLDPTAGEIRIDGRRLDEVTRPDWQRQIGHVPQAIYLSDASIAANIAFGVPESEIDFEAVCEAARRSQIHDFICSLPEGYGTSVGERGVRLSGGQRQRIGIARALYKQANVLILDEATSALDHETEAAVIEAIGQLGPDLTIFMIAHRLSSLSGCDLIVRLAGGRIVDQGSPAEVLGDPVGPATGTAIR